MARVAGLHPGHGWADRTGRPFDEDSPSLVAVDAAAMMRP
jgi:hypothetical protein